MLQWTQGGLQCNAGGENQREVFGLVLPTITNQSYKCHKTECTKEYYQKGMAEPNLSGSHHFYTSISAPSCTALDSYSSPAVPQLCVCVFHQGFETKLSA